MIGWLDGRRSADECEEDELAPGPSWGSVATLSGFVMAAAEVSCVEFSRMDSPVAVCW